MSETVETFSQILGQHGVSLERKPAEILQINLGLLCNQACRHCHLAAGPDRTEIMSRETIEQVIAFQARCRFNTIDITGGAPEMNPSLVFLVEEMAPMARTLMLRSNLAALHELKDDLLLTVLKRHRVTIVSSFPSLDADQTDSQRGKGIFDKSIQTLQRLNRHGYGQAGTGLELNLVSNPSGAFPPLSQAATEKRYRQVLLKKWGIVFNHAYTFANMPLGRFREWLARSGNLDAYLAKLHGSFNPCTLPDLMCRSLISVSWDGFLYDCDFNQAAEIYKGNVKTHVSDVAACSFENDAIAVGNHCYACTAGSGFT